MDFSDFDDLFKKKRLPDDEAFIERQRLARDALEEERRIAENTFAEKQRINKIMFDIDEKRNQIEQLRNVRGTEQQRRAIEASIAQLERSLPNSNSNVNEFVENSRIGRDLMTIRKLYNDLERMRGVQAKTRQRNSIKARIVELSRGLPRFFEDKPNPIPLPLETVNTLLETYGPYANESLRRPSQPRPQSQQPRRGVPSGFVDFNIGEDRKKLVGKLVRVNQDGHKYRGVVTDVTVSGAQVQSTSDNRIRIVHPSKLTIIGSAFTPEEREREEVPRNYFERTTPNLTAPTPSGFVMSREDELDHRSYTPFANLESTIQNILVIIKRNVPSRVSLPFANTIATAVLPELVVVQTNLKISYNTQNLYRSLVSAFVHLYLEPRIKSGSINVPGLVAQTGYVSGMEKGGQTIPARDIVNKFVDLLRAKYSVSFPVHDTQTISYIGRAKSRKYVQMHKDSWPSLNIREGEMGARNRTTFFTPESDSYRRTDQTSTLPLQSSINIPKGIKYGPSMKYEGDDWQKIFGVNPGEALFELSPQEERDLQILESKEEQLIDRLQQKRADPLYERIHTLKVHGNSGAFNPKLNTIDARLDEIANELVQFSKERESKLRAEQRRRGGLLEPESQEDDPEYIKLKRNALYKEKARLMTRRSVEQKKNSSDVSDDQTEALRSQLRDATSEAQKKILSNQLREAKRSKNPDSLVDEEISQLEAQLVRKYGSPETMLNRLQKLRRVRELRAKARESMGALFE